MSVTVVPAAVAAVKRSTVSVPAVILSVFVAMSIVIDFFKSKKGGTRFSQADRTTTKPETSSIIVLQTSEQSGRQFGDGPYRRT